MQINDKFLTVVTGVVLAIGGATASLFLGEDDAHITDPNAIVIASTAQPTLPNVLAAIEPAKREERGDFKLDLNAFGTLAVAPELAKPADFTDLVMTRTPSAIDTPELPKVAASLPDMPLNIADLIKIKPVEAASCALDIRATPIFGARVTLRLNAPCHPNVSVTIKHGGLQFKERLDKQGTLELKVPAFAEYSRFDIELADGLTSTVGAYISGLSSLERVGIAWSGADDTFLHALENGAKAGDTGHIWRVKPNSFAKARMSGGGYMMVLGDPTLENAKLAQVYTLPQRPRKRAQIVELQIETLRGEYACGTDIDLKVAHHRVNSGAAQSELSLTLPACGSEDTSLVLKNAIKDMKVARK